MKSEKNIFLAFILNVIFALIEFIGGLFTNSIAILSDSVHDLGDALSLGVSYFFEKKSKNRADNTFTYGYARYSIIGSLFTTIILIVSSIILIINSVKRIFQSTNINYNGMILISIFGLIINISAFYSTKDGNSLNEKTVNLHMLEDVVGWIIVLIGAIVMRFTDIKIIDPILSILLAIFIMIHCIKNFREITDLFLIKNPLSFDIDQIMEDLNGIENVINIHHFHAWSIDGINNCASLHVIVKDFEKTAETKQKIKKYLKKFKVKHLTIEFETEKTKCLTEKCQF